MALLDPHRRLATLWLLLSLIGCSQEPTRELPALAGALLLPGGRSVLHVAVNGELGLWSLDQPRRVLDREVLPQLALDPKRSLVVYARRPPAGGELWAADLSGRWRHQLTTGGAACLPAISPDGRRVAFIDTSPQGLASLFVVPVEGGAPRQVTNVGLRAVGRGPPAGFIPPPETTGGLSWEGEAIVVESRRGRFVVRPGAIP